MNNELLKIDIGCGNTKMDGHIGLDYINSPSVDHVLDLTKDKFPFEDNSIDEVFSSHFLEHIGAPNHVFGEIGRVCKNEAKIEFWTPYAFHDDAFLYGHVTYLTEKPWINFCVTHRETFKTLLNGYWELKEVQFILLPETLKQLKANKIKVEFAIKYLKNIVYEFGVKMIYKSEKSQTLKPPKYYWAHSRNKNLTELTQQF